jgi:Zn-dependent peptidase ImmA (M78 family)
LATRGLALSANAGDSFASLHARGACPKPRFEGAQPSHECRSFALELAAWLDSRFDLPKVAVPRYRGIGASTAADAVRTEWGLGERPIRNMIHLLETKGVRVFSLAEETRDIDAFSLWEDGVPYIFLNTMKSAEHGRMDAAHELAHLVLHSQHEDFRRNEEHEANLFAGAFLMPRGSVIAEAPRGGRMNDLVAAKVHWGVSLSALAYRMHELGILSDWQYHSVFVEISRMGYRTSEPKGIGHESSSVLATVFKMLRDQGVRRTDVARALDLPTEELQKLVFGLVLSPVSGMSAEAGT